MRVINQSVLLTSLVDIPCLSGEFRFLIGSSESRYGEAQLLRDCYLLAGSGHRLLVSWWLGFF